MININNVSVILLIALPFSLVTGPAIPDISISLIGILFLIQSYKNKDFKFLREKIIIIFLILNFYLVIRSIFSEYILNSLSNSLFYFRFLIFSLAFSFLIEKKSTLLKFFSIAIFLSIFLVFLDTSIQWLTGKNVFGWSSGNKLRLSSFFQTELIVGSFLTKLTIIIISINIIYVISNSKRYIMTLLFLNFVSIIVLASGERASFGIILIFFLGLLIFVRKYYLIKLLSFSLFTFLFILTINLSSSVNQRFFSTFEEIKATNSNFAFFTAHHQQHYYSAIKMFKSNIFFGKGPNNFKIYCSQDSFNTGPDSCSTHPHNYYIELLGETGLIGFVIFSTFFLFCLLNIFKQLYKIYYLNKNINFNILFICFAITLFYMPFVPTGSFYNNWVNVFNYILIGFLIYELRKIENDKNR